MRIAPTARALETMIASGTRSLSSPLLADCLLALPAASLSSRSPRATTRTCKSRRSSVYVLWKLSVQMRSPAARGTTLCGDQPQPSPLMRTRSRGAMVASEAALSVIHDESSLVLDGASAIDGTEPPPGADCSIVVRCSSNLVWFTRVYNGNTTRSLPSESARRVAIATEVAGALPPLGVPDAAAELAASCRSRTYTNKLLTCSNLRCCSVPPLGILFDGAGAMHRERHIPIWFNGTASMTSKSREASDVNGSAAINSGSRSL